MILRIWHIFSQFLQKSIQSLLLWLGRSLTTVSSWAGWMKRINLEMALLNAGPASLWSRWSPKHTHTAPYTCQFSLFDSEDYFFEYLKLCCNNNILVFYHRGYSTHHLVEGLESSTSYNFRLRVTRASGECSLSPVVSVFTNREIFYCTSSQSLGLLLFSYFKPSKSHAPLCCYW